MGCSLAASSLSPPLPLGSDGGAGSGTAAMEQVIKVIGDEAFVNGQRVEPHAP
jgi:hypothetical protein